MTSDARSWQWRRDQPAAEVLGGRGAAVVGQNVSSLGGSVGTATLRYAGRNRRSVIRRRVPPTSSARTEMAGIARTGIGSATAAARHVLGILCTGFADQVAQRKDDGMARGQSSLIISAHTNPASSRAIAAATTDLLFLTAASRQKRPHSRVWAVHARATVSGGTPCWRWRRTAPTPGRCW